MTAMEDSTSLINLADYEKAAKKTLTQMAFDYYQGAACDAITRDLNSQAFKDIFLVPKVLAGNSIRSQKINIFGTSCSSPIIIAPSSFHGLAHSNGELATTKGAQLADTIMTLSLMSNTALEDHSAYEKKWFQLFFLTDQEATKDLVKRAERANFRAIVITVDAQVLGIREADFRNKFSLPKNLSLPNLSPYIKDISSTTSAGSQNLFNKSVTWKDIEWLKSNTHLPIILKGIIHQDDALKAAAIVDGIVISNHGGRQLDTCIPAITALPKIAKSLQNKLPLFIDGGIKRGTDILKAIALGADAILLGRPIIWGLAAEGSQGVCNVLDILKKELDVAMGLCGFSSIEEIKENGHKIIYREKFA